MRAVPALRGKDRIKKHTNLSLALLVQVEKGPEDNGWAAVFTA